MRDFYPDGMSKLPDEEPLYCKNCSKAVALDELKDCPQCENQVVCPVCTFCDECEERVEDMEEKFYCMGCGEEIGEDDAGWCSRKCWDESHADEKRDYDR